MEIRLLIRSEITCFDSHHDGKTRTQLVLVDLLLLCTLPLEVVRRAHPWRQQWKAHRNRPGRLW
jgi:hypothetical protein